MQKAIRFGNWARVRSPARTVLQESSPNAHPRTVPLNHRIAAPPHSTLPACDRPSDATIRRPPPSLRCYGGVTVGLMSFGDGPGGKPSRPTGEDPGPLSGTRSAQANAKTSVNAYDSQSKTGSSGQHPGIAGVSPAPPAFGARPRFGDTQTRRPYSPVLLLSGGQRHTLILGCAPRNLSFQNSAPIMRPVQARYRFRALSSRKRSM